jgi:hypothetical protein
LAVWRSPRTEVELCRFALFRELVEFELNGTRHAIIDAVRFFDTGQF